MIQEFHVLKLRIEMNLYDSTHSLHCERFSCETENHIRGAVAVAVAIGHLHDGVTRMPLVASIVRLIFPIVSLFPREKTNFNKKAF